MFFLDDGLRRERSSIFFINFFLGIIIALLSGCATPARSVNMIPDSYQVKNRYNYSVELRVEGGKKQTFMDGSQITNEGFKGALEEAIRKSEIFSKISEGNNSEYLLAVQIITLDRPLVGIKHEVKLATNWKLINLKSQEKIWDEFIVSSYTATPSDSISGITRLRLANEGAARENIKEGISQLSHVDLSGN